MKMHAYWFAGAASVAVAAAIAVGCNDTETAPSNLLSAKGAGSVQHTSGKSLLGLQAVGDSVPGGDTTVIDPFPDGLEGTEEPCAECIGGDPPAEIEVHIVSELLKSTKMKLTHIATGDDKSRYETVYHFPDGPLKSKKYKLIFEHVKEGENKSKYRRITTIPITEAVGGIE